MIPFIDAAAEATETVPNAKGILERALEQTGIPIGSTEEARGSPVLEARDLLRAAAEIEHGLLAQYLYAAYSCANSGIRLTLFEIAKQEMGHLICVQNLLLALGGLPYFGREHFPVTPGSSEVFPFALAFEPVSLDSLAKYVVAESPPLESITDQDLRRRVEPIVAVGKGAAHQPINHVGALYVALYWLFKQDDTAPVEWKDYPTDLVIAVHRQQGRTDWHLRDADFAKQSDIQDLQANNASEDWTRGDDTVLVRAISFLGSGVADRVPMLQTLFDIADQGEGWQQPQSGDLSHFLKFLETYELVRTTPPGSTPVAINVPVNPSTVEPAASGFIANPEANLWGQTFNLRYRILILKLSLAMASRRSLDAGKPDGRATLITDALKEMKTVIRKIATELVRMRRKGLPADGPEPMKAAPPFEFPPGSLPNLVGVDPDPKVAEIRAITLLRRALKAALEDMIELVSRVNKLPTNLLDVPAPRQLLDEIVTNDAALLAALA